jgi:hypothetical protein
VTQHGICRFPSCCNMRKSSLYGISSHLAVAFLCLGHISCRIYDSLVPALWGNNPMLRIPSLSSNRLETGAIKTLTTVSGLWTESILHLLPDSELTSIAQQTSEYPKVVVVHDDSSSGDPRFPCRSRITLKWLRGLQYRISPQYIAHYPQRLPHNNGIHS